MYLDVGVKIRELVRDAKDWGSGMADATLEQESGPEVLKGTRHYNPVYAKRKKQLNPATRPQFKRKKVSWSSQLLWDCKLVDKLQLELSLREDGRVYARARLYPKEDVGCPYEYWTKPWKYIGQYDIDNEMSILEIRDQWHSEGLVVKLARVVQQDPETYAVYRAMKWRGRERSKRP